RCAHFLQSSNGREFRLSPEASRAFAIENAVHGSSLGGPAGIGHLAAECPSCQRDGSIARTGTAENRASAHRLSGRGERGVREDAGTLEPIAAREGLALLQHCRRRAPDVLVGHPTGGNCRFREGCSLAYGLAPPHQLL